MASNYADEVDYGAYEVDYDEEEADYDEDDIDHANTWPVQPRIPQIQIGGMPPPSQQHQQLSSFIQGPPVPPLSGQQQQHFFNGQRQSSYGSATSHSSSPSVCVSSGGQLQQQQQQQQYGGNMTNSYLQVVGSQRHVSGSSATSHSSTSSARVGSVHSHVYSAQPSPAFPPAAAQQHYTFSSPYTQASGGQRQFSSGSATSHLSTTSSTYPAGLDGPFQSNQQQYMAAQHQLVPVLGGHQQQETQSTLGNGGYGYGMSQLFSSTRPGQPRPPPLQHRDPTPAFESQFEPSQPTPSDVHHWSTQFSEPTLDHTIGYAQSPIPSSVYQQQQQQPTTPLVQQQQMPLSYYSQIQQDFQFQYGDVVGPRPPSPAPFTPSALNFHPSVQQDYMTTNNAQQQSPAAPQSSAAAQEFDNAQDTTTAGGAVIDWKSLLDEVEAYQNETKTPMTEEQKIQFAAYAAWRQRERKSTKRMADRGAADFDDDDLEDAVHANKRLRVADANEPPNNSRQFYEQAQMVYAFGPPNNPELPIVDPLQEELDGLALDEQLFGLSPYFKIPHTGETLHFMDALVHNGPSHKALDPDFRLIETICSNFWLMIEITKHLPVKDLVMLYSISKTFREAVNERFMATITAWAEHKSSSGWRVFYWKFYGKYCITDPVGKPWSIPGPVEIPRPAWATSRRVISEQTEIRKVPSFKYLAMLDEREVRVRDILACLARAGHRMPATMHITLKKVWMIMDMATNQLRRAFMHNKKLWTDVDLYNTQLFVLKLHMRFNEPIFGPCSLALGQTFLGARKGLTPLWKLLRRKAYTDPREVIQQRVRYFCPDDISGHYALLGEPYFDVHPVDLGMEHKEGWGSGNLHLMRPDELVIEESVRRRIDMKRHLIFMAFWGHVDWKGRRNLVPTEEEMYMSDDELPKQPKKGVHSRYGLLGRCGNVPFEYENWHPKHAMKARWNTLPDREKEMIRRDDAQELMRALPFEDENDAFWNPYNANDEPESEKGDNGGALFDGEEGGEEDIDYGEMDPDNDAISLDSDLVEYTLGASLPPDLEIENRPEVEYEDADPSPPPIPVTVTDPDIIANWADMDPYLQQIVIADESRLAAQDRRDERTVAAIVRKEAARRKRKFEASLEWVRAHHAAGQMVGDDDDDDDDDDADGEEKATDHHYRYPNIRDPVLRELLKKYDQFSPRDFERGGEDESGDEPDYEVESMDEDEQEAPGADMEEQEELEMEHDPDDEVSDNGSAYTNPLLNVDPEDMDDTDLQALADIDYSDDDLDIDLKKYKKFLDRVGGDGATKTTDQDDEDASDDGDINDHEEDWDDGDGIVHEADLDDDESALPEMYDFRKY